MKLLEIYESFFSAKALFIAGLFIIPSLLFNPLTELRVLQFIFFWFLVFLSGKKSNPLLTLIVILCIVIFNLIIPYGKVLFSVGPFKITSGALQAGVHRAVTFEALIMLSKLTVRQDLKIPGSFGELLGESLRIFSVMMNKKYRITGKNLIAEIDKFMLEFSAEDSAPPQDRRGQKTRFIGFIIIALVIILSWIPFFIGFFPDFFPVILIYQFK